MDCSSCDDLITKTQDVFRRIMEVKGKRDSLPARLEWGDLMQKWEYLIAGVMEPKRLNELGEQGWELVAVTETHTFYFKRPLSQPI